MKNGILTRSCIYNLYDGPNILIRNNENASFITLEILNNKNINEYFKNTFMLSQEEIDALTEELSEYHEKLNKKDSQLDFNLINNKTQCAHIWRDYQGLNESFKYCTVCDEKMK